MAFQKKNFAVSTLGADIANSATTGTVATGAGGKFPTGNFLAVIWGASFSTPDKDPNAEIILVNTISGDSITSMTRAQEGTAAAAHSAGDNFVHILTAGTFDDYATKASVRSISIADHGAVGDAQLKADGTLMAGSAALQAGTGVFSAADVGKAIGLMFPNVGINEDFTAYTKYDPSSKLTVTASKISTSSLAGNQVAYVYKDYGAGYFAGDFTQYGDWENSGGNTGSPEWVAWGLSDAVGTNGISDASNCVFFKLFISGGTFKGILVEKYGGTAYGSTQYTEALNGARYWTVTRVGTTLTFTTYTNSSRTTVENTYTLTLHSAYAYEYCYGFSSFATTAGDIVSSCYSENFLLYEAPSAPQNQKTTISAYVSPTEVTLADAATYNAKGNLSYAWGTDNTTPIQNALDDAVNQGVSNVVVPDAAFLCAGNLTIPPFTSLIGASTGPFRAVYSPASSGLSIPQLWPLDTTDNFITTGKASTPSGNSGGTFTIADLMIYYPTQATPVCTQPIFFPATIFAGDGSSCGMLKRLTLVNSYTGIGLGFDLNADGSFNYGKFNTSGKSIGQIYLEDLFVGGLKCGIGIDHAMDVMYAKTIHMLCPWDLYTPTSIYAGLNSPLTSWVNTNGYGWIINRCDLLMAQSIYAFKRHAGMWMTDSTDPNLSNKTSYGQINNCQWDSCTYGIVCASTNAASAWVVQNIATAGSVTSTVRFEAPTGVNYPKMKVMGGFNSASVSTAFNKNSVANSFLDVSGVVGYNPTGKQTPPAVPASGTAYYNPFPYACRVNITGGTVTDISIGGYSTGLTGGGFILGANETITLTYSVAPTWTWFGM